MPEPSEKCRSDTQISKTRPQSPQRKTTSTTFHRSLFAALKSDTYMKTCCQKELSFLV
jgi:hypothetical protein